MALNVSMHTRGGLYRSALPIIPAAARSATASAAKARAIAYFLRIIDLYCQGRGVKPADVGKLDVEMRVQPNGSVRWRITGP